MLEALIFDVDGTIAETEEVHRRAFNLAFARHGVDLAWDARAYRRLLRIPGGKARIARSLAEHGREVEVSSVDEVHETKTRFYEMLMDSAGVPWRPGIRRLIDEARREGLAIALATTTTEANLQPLFAPHLGAAWRSCFGAIVAGDDVPLRKPAPDVYVEALRRLGVRAANAVAFEDSAAGVEAARTAGLAVVATPSEWLEGDDLDGADLVLEHLGDSGRPWQREHPLLGERWLSARALAAWHRGLHARPHACATASRSHA